MQNYEFTKEELQVLANFGKKGAKIGEEVRQIITENMSDISMILQVQKISLTQYLQEIYKIFYTVKNTQNLTADAFKKLIGKKARPSKQKPAKQQKNSLKNEKLIKDFENFLTSQKIEYKKEAVFSKFLPTKRQFRADYLFESLNLTVEINGGSRPMRFFSKKTGKFYYSSGRHNTPDGYKKDLQKINLLTVNGYKCLQYTYDMLKSKDYETDILTLIETKKHNKMQKQNNYFECFDSVLGTTYEVIVCENNFKPKNTQQNDNQRKSN